MEQLTIDVNAPVPPPPVDEDDVIPGPSSGHEPVPIPEVDRRLLNITRHSLGKGTFGQVFRATYGNQGYVAVKLKEDKTTDAAILKEISLLHLHGGGSEHIIRLYGCIRQPTLGYVMEYMDCGSLDELINKRKSLHYRIDHVMSYLRQASSATAYMHSVGFVHRDLKPQNLLLCNRYLTLKLCDFGTVALLRQTMTNCRGSALWMAPEVFQGPKYDASCDVFSMSIILWQMVARRKPYPDSNPYAILWNVRQGARPPTLTCHPLLWALIQKMWSKEPKDRPSMKSVEQFAQVMMTVYKGYNEPLVDMTPDDDMRTPQPLFGSSLRISTSSQLSSSPDAQSVRGHRRGGSYDTTLINTDTVPSTSMATSAASTPRSTTPAQRAARSQSFALPRRGQAGSSANGQDSTNDLTDEDVTNALEPQLQPLQPLWSDEQSMQKYNMHMAYAYAYTEAKAQCAQLRKEKHRVITAIKDRLEEQNLAKKKASLERTLLSCYEKIESGRLRPQPRARPPPPVRGPHPPPPPIGWRIDNLGRPS